MKFLSIDEMLDAAQETSMPNLRQYREMVESAANLLGIALSNHLGIVSGATNMDFGETFVPFWPKTPDQKCPPVINMADMSGDWEMPLPESPSIFPDGQTASS